MAVADAFLMNKEINKKKNQLSDVWIVRNTDSCKGLAVPTRHGWTSDFAQKVLAVSNEFLLFRWSLLRQSIFRSSIFIFLFKFTAHFSSNTIFFFFFHSFFLAAVTLISNFFFFLMRNEAENKDIKHHKNSIEYR